MGAGRGSRDSWLRSIATEKMAAEREPPPFGEGDLEGEEEEDADAEAEAEFRELEASEDLFVSTTSTLEVNAGSLAGAARLDTGRQ